MILMISGTGHAERRRKLLDGRARVDGDGAGRRAAPAGCSARGFGRLARRRSRLARARSLRVDDDAALAAPAEGAPPRGLSGLCRSAIVRAIRPKASNGGIVTFRRKVRANARRAAARSKHAGRLQVYAPRPGERPPRPASARPAGATKRTSSRCGAFRPQPTHVLVGSLTPQVVLLLGSGGRLDSASACCSWRPAPQARRSVSASTSSSRSRRRDGLGRAETSSPRPPRAASSRCAGMPQ